MSRRALGDASIRAFVRTKQPLDGGRPGRPADLDDAVVFFLSDALALRHRPGPGRRRRMDGDRGGAPRS